MRIRIQLSESGNCPGYRAGSLRGDGQKGQDGKDTSGMKMTDSIVVRLGLALGVSGLLIVYAMSSSLKGISVFRSDVSRILEQNQLLVLSDQKVIAYGLLEEMALRNLLLNPDDSVAARNLHKFEKMSLGMLSQGKSETYTLKDPVSRARILRDLDALETKFKDHLATISLILSILPSDRTKALRLMKVREVSEWRKIRRDIQALISISQHDVAVKQEQLSEKYHRIMLESISTAAFGIAFSILALGLVYLRFRKGVGQALLVSKKLANCDLSFSPKDQHSDEFGKIIHAIDGAVVRFRDVIGSIKSIEEKITGHSQDLSRVSGQTGESSQEIRRLTANVVHVDERIEEALSRSIGLSRETTKEAEKIVEVSQEGVQIGERSKTAYEHILLNIRKTRESLRKLSDSVSRVNKATSSVREISEQTNLLALNAAIEAARAGEVGKGFAVVAEEVRKLSQKSSESTKEIGEVVDQIRAMSEETGILMESTEKVVGEGAEATAETGQAFGSIHKAVSNLPSFMKEIDSSFETLRTEQEKSRTEVQEIDRFSDQLMSGQQTLDVVSANLQEQAMELEEAVRQFRF